MCFKNKKVLEMKFYNSINGNILIRFYCQQNDMIFLSMVKTENPGYSKDIRRIIVHKIKAKYGIYQFGKYKFFSIIPKLSRALQQFVTGPLKLIPNETYPNKRLANDEGKHIEQFIQAPCLNQSETQNSYINQYWFIENGNNQRLIIYNLLGQ